MILTEKEIIEAFESIQPCSGSGQPCDICKNALTILNSDFFTPLFLAMLLNPHLIGMFASKMIAVGMALAETKKMEEIFK